MQETLKDLSTQQKENAEEKYNDASSNFAYLSARREMALNLKVSLCNFTKKGRICIFNNKNAYYYDNVSY